MDEDIARLYMLDDIFELNKDSDEKGYMKYGVLDLNLQASTVWRVL